MPLSAHDTLALINQIHQAKTKDDMASISGNIPPKTFSRFLTFYFMTKHSNAQGSNVDPQKEALDHLIRFTEGVRLHAAKSFEIQLFGKQAGLTLTPPSPLNPSTSFDKRPPSFSPSLSSKGGESQRQQQQQQQGGGMDLSLSFVSRGGEREVPSSPSPPSTNVIISSNNSNSNSPRDHAQAAYTPLPAESQFSPLLSSSGAGGGGSGTGGGGMSIHGGGSFTAPRMSRLGGGFSSSSPSSSGRPVSAIPGHQRDSSSSSSPRASRPGTAVSQRHKERDVPSSLSGGASSPPPPSSLGLALSSLKRSNY